METKKELYKKLAEFQQKCPVILKDTSGHNYKYADLPKINEVILPIFGKVGLGYIQPLNGKNITTRVFDIETGESIESDTEIPFDSLEYKEVEKVDKRDKSTYKTHVILGFEGMNKAQAYGSLITYFRRYALSSLLGLVTDKDTDAGGAIVSNDLDF